MKCCNTNKEEIILIYLEMQLKNAEEMHDFAKKCSRLKCEADLVSGRSIVDAKSILGVFSLDLSRKLKLILYTDDMETVLADMKPYVIAKHSIINEKIVTVV